MRDLQLFEQTFPIVRMDRAVRTQKIPYCCLDLLIVKIDHFARDTDLRQTIARLAYCSLDLLLLTQIIPLIVRIVEQQRIAKYACHCKRYVTARRAERNEQQGGLGQVPPQGAHNEIYNKSLTAEGKVYASENTVETPNNQFCQLTAIKNFARTLPDCVKLFKMVTKPK